MGDVLTGDPDVDEAIRRILGLDDEDDDEDGGTGGDGGEWAGVTVLASIAPTRVDGVRSPANGIPILLAKSARRGVRGSLPDECRVLKADAERRFTLMTAYAASRVDVSTAADGFQDFATAGTIEQGAWTFLDKGRQVGIEHRDGSTGAGTIVESSIHRAPPWTLTAADGSQQTVMPGDWLVGVQWGPAGWAMVKSGQIKGISMQGTASRRQPTAAELAGLRKSAARRPRCGKCQKRARSADARFCVKCGTALGKAAPAKAVKSAALVKAEAAVRTRAAAQGAAAASRAARLVRQARSADADIREAAFSRLAGELGVEAAVHLLSGDVTTAVLGARVAKAAADDEMSRCKTCAGGGRLRHPGTGKASRTCPSCRGSGQWTPDGDQADMTEDDASLVGQYARQAKAGGPDSADALGKLAEMLGPDVAVRLVSGEPIGPGEFRRAYITACRAPQSGAGGRAPRVPAATHVAEPSDFRRGPLGAGQSRPAPASRWPGQGGQMDFYQGGAGVRQDNVPWSARSPAETWPTAALASSARG